MVEDNGKMKFYSIGEFAKLSNTTRDTLLYYDSMGILKPAHVGENGYRYYVMIQVYQVHWIRYMQRLGIKLSDLQKHMKIEPNNDSFISLLESVADNAEEELKRQRMLLRVIHNTINTLKNELVTDVNVPYFDYMEEEYLITSKIDTFQDPLHLGRLQELMDYVNDSYLWDEVYIGSIVTQDRLEKGDISTNYWYTRIHMPIHDDRVMVKPSGTYAVLLYDGSPYELVAAHEHLIAFIEENGYKIAGNAYEEDIGGYWPFTGKNQCMNKIMIQVEHIDEA